MRGGHSRARRIVVTVTAVALLCSCGGGGGGGTTPAAPSSPPPTLTLATSQSRVAVDDPITLNWSSTNAASCTAAGAWEGVQSTSGSVTVTQPNGGRYTFTLACSGAGGTVNRSVEVVVPLRVFGTSYENKTQIAVVATAFPSIWDPSMDRVRAKNPNIGFSPRSLAFGDFLQEGRMQAVVSSSVYANAYPGSNPQKWPDSPGSLLFLKQASDGRWDDVTDQLIPNPAERTTCVMSNYTLVADFNNDRKPDLYVACTGIDFQVNGVWTSDQYTQQLVFISQPDGTYKRGIAEATPIYGHQATAGDIDRDGNVDIVTVDVGTFRQPYVLWGNGDGSFRRDLSRMPSDVYGKEGIYGVNLVPVDGQLKLIVSGFGPGSLAAPACSNNECYGTKIMRYAQGGFQVETDLTPLIPVGRNGRQFGLALDVVVWNRSLYFYHVSEAYAEDAVVRVDWTNMTAHTVYAKLVSNWYEGLVLINITKDGFLELYGARCNTYDMPPTDACRLHLPLT